MVPILGPYATELREDAAIIAVVGVDENGVRRVRRVEPEPGDVKGPGEFIPFIVLTILDAPPDPNVPVTWATIGARCYGSNHQNAWAVYVALCAAVHRVGPRVKSSGLGIYRTLIAGGGEQQTDPDTHQPVVPAVISLIAATQVIA